MSLPGANEREQSDSLVDSVLQAHWRDLLIQTAPHAFRRCRLAWELRAVQVCYGEVCTACMWHEGAMRPDNLHSAVRQIEDAESCLVRVRCLHSKTHYGIGHVPAAILSSEHVH